MARSNKKQIWMRNVLYLACCVVFTGLFIAYAVGDAQADPILSPLVTGDPDCEYHGDLCSGCDPYDNETLTIQNYGNETLIYEIQVAYLSGSNWLTIDGAQYIPSTPIEMGGAADTYDIVMNALTTYWPGLWQAEIQIFHNVPAVDNPFIIPIDFFTADSFICDVGVTITTPCVALEVANVASFGRENPYGGMRHYNELDADSLFNPVFDGSFLLANRAATAQGPDTIVYRDIFHNQTPSNPGFRALEELKLSYNAAADESVATANLVTVDSTIGITVKYLFPQAGDSCDFIRIMYRIYPYPVYYSGTPDPYCDGYLTVDLQAGMAVDFDIGTAAESGITNGDVGGFIPNFNLVYQQGSDEDTLIAYPDVINVTNRFAAGITALTCQPLPRMAIQSTRVYVYPMAGFTDDYIYHQLDSTGVTIWWDNSGESGGEDDIVDDLHAIVGFPEVALGEGDTREDGGYVYHLALVSSQEAQEGIDVTDYHTAAGYANYVTDLIDQTRKAWKKGFGWGDDFAFTYPLNPGYPLGLTENDKLYLVATGTHEDGLAGGCCGCEFSLIDDGGAGELSVIDDGNCRAHLQLSGVPFGNYAITVRVADLCGSQADDLTFDIEVTSSPHYCGLPGDVNGDGKTDPLDVVYLVKYVYKGQDALCDYAGITFCLYANGDLDGNGGPATPLDVSLLVNAVYKSLWALCLDRSTGCP